MTAAVRSELRKFFTTRLWWGMGIAVLVTGAGFAALLALVLTLGNENGRPIFTGVDLARRVFTGGISVGYLLTLAIGVMTIGAEYRHKTITATFLATPKRLVVMGAKVVALLVIGALYGVVSLAGAVVAGGSILAAKGLSPFADAGVWRTLLLALLVLGLWALIGLGVGILIPNQVAALLISIGVAWIVEPIAAGLLPLVSWGEHVAPYFPSSATGSMLGTGGGFLGGQGTDTQPLSWWTAALVLAAYAAVMAGIGSWLTVRRDIS